MKDCVFCKIISGEIPSYKIYEDDFCLAFLDISNDVYGHTLVIPKKHYETMITCDNTTLSRVIETCKKIGDFYVKEKGIDGYNILNNTGSVAGQSVKHIHFHVIPRKEGDEVKLFNELPDCGADLNAVCEELKLPKENVVSCACDDAVVIYTDGACSGNPGAGGWASILNFKGKEKILSGGEENTTNNRMELMAVIQGLESVKDSQIIKVYSDSAYVVNAFNQNWLSNWQKNNWKTSGKSEVLNKDLWQRLLKVVQKHNVEFIKVKGHSDNENNNRCDALAREEIIKLQD